MRIITEFNGPDLRAQFNRNIDNALDEFGQAIVDALQGAGSAWPVRTGSSKTGFSFRRRGDDILLTNLEDYARYVNNNEELNGGHPNPNFNAVGETWRRNENAIRDRVERVLVED